MNTDLIVCTMLHRG